MSNKPYHFTVNVNPSASPDAWWVRIVVEHDDFEQENLYPDFGPFPTEEAANHRAELIRQAMQRVV